MIAIVFLVGGSLMVAALIGVVYLASRRGKGDEIGRRTEVPQGPKVPKRTEGRET